MFHMKKALLRETVQLRIFCRKVFILHLSNLSFLIMSLLTPPPQVSGSYYVSHFALSDIAQCIFHIRSQAGTTSFVFSLEGQKRKLFI